MTYTIRPITQNDDTEIVKIIRKNLESYHLDIPGTAYFDLELDHLSNYYAVSPQKRAYLIAENDKGEVLGGVGIAEFTGFESCAEIQKLYLTDEVKGIGLGRQLVEMVTDLARDKGYHTLYLETHSALTSAIGLYKKLGFSLIEKPESVLHTTMDQFYMKEIQ